MDDIRRLWELLPHLTTADGPTTTRWFAKSLDGREKAGGAADTVGELVNAVVHTPDKNFYVCPNPSSVRHKVRHNTEDTSHWSWFLIDIDPMKGATDPNPRVLLEKALTWIGEWNRFIFTEHSEFTRRPLIIDSGRGMQAWIRLEDVLLDDTVPMGQIIRDEQGLRTARGTARLTMRYWLDRLDDLLGEVAGCRIDTTCSDLPRPMRCPGTINVKTKRMASLVVASSEVYRGFAEKLVAQTPPEKFTVIILPTLPEGTEWQDVYVHLTIKAQRYLVSGKIEPGRHETMWHTARSLAEKGLTRDAVRRGIEWANQRRGVDMALSSEDIEHALNTAFSRLTMVAASDSISVPSSPQEAD